MWYNGALRSINAFPLVFEHHLQPRFFPKFDLKVEGEALLRLWGEKPEEFIAAKLEDKKRYDQRVRDIFAAARQKKAASVLNRDLGL
ncbi:hypothetical protein LTR62_000959 [Meristemomyces frigidus]|uniref:Uncharacterized protein n=1 Tax=Meristemomyces frigidus TaxID=1508187 RepID=A0AAN7YC11_9PEZI|nr:hypothetical protein LTR62_000959 [Meristemomyces frigidus]